MCTIVIACVFEETLATVRIHYEIPDIISTMLKEYDVEEAVLRDEVEKFVALLHKDNIV